MNSVLSLCLLLGALRLPLAVLWGPFGRLGAPVGHLLEFVENWADIIAPAHENQHTCDSPAASADPGKVVSGTAARTPPPHTPGVRITC